MTNPKLISTDFHAFNFRVAMHKSHNAIQKLLVQLFVLSKDHTKVILVLSRTQLPWTAALNFIQMFSKPSTSRYFYLKSIPIGSTVKLFVVDLICVADSRVLVSPYSKVIFDIIFVGTTFLNCKKKIVFFVTLPCCGLLYEPAVVPLL